MFANSWFHKAGGLVVPAAAAGLLAVTLLVSCSPAKTPEPAPPPTATQPAEPTVLFTGEACSYQGPEALEAGEVVLNIKSTDQAFVESAVMVMTLYEGKTVADLQAWMSTDKPGWSELVTGKVLKEAAEDSFIIKVNRGPVYLVYFVSPPEKKVGVIGPIEVKE